MKTIIIIALSISLTTIALETSNPMSMILCMVGAFLIGVFVNYSMIEED